MISIDNKTKLLTQSNSLTSAKYDFTPLEKNIMYMVMDQLSNDDPVDKYYFISIQEIFDKTKVQSNYADYIAATERLLTKVITIKRENGNILKTTFVSSAEYIKGQGIIEIGIEPKLRPHLFDLKMGFTTFELEEVLSLKSRYSKRIYEMLAQFKKTNYFIIKVTDLKERLGLIDLVQKTEKYPKWNMFERRVLKVAKAEINSYSDLNFEYKLKKKGRKIETIEFFIKKSS